MVQQPGLDADLCRLLARAIGSPYYRYALWTIEMMADGATARDYLMKEAMQAYTFTNLPQVIQSFLSLCDRSVQIHAELFSGKRTGLSTEQEDAQVIEEMVRQGDIEETDEAVDEED